ncbi:MAG TPA: tetratricopeptide repeat protein [Steroidobacteraceae bacterium]
MITAWPNRSDQFRAAVAIAMGALLAGCALQSRVAAPSLDIPALNGAAPSDSRGLPQADDFLAVDDAMRAYARDVLAPIVNPRERVRRLAADLIAPHSPLAIRYSEEDTLTASEVLRRREGNCLSFSALVVQLARLAGLEAHFQDVPVLPQWRVAGGTFVVERHVDAVVPLGAVDGVIDFRPPTAATYTRATLISDANATARYFGNLGVERFTAGDLEGAYRLYRRGLEIDRRAAMLWLNLGVVYARNGQWQDAEHAYRTTLALSPGDLSAMNNLALTLEQLGDADGAKRLQAKVAHYRLRNPYFLFWQGERSLQSGDASAAIEWFRKATSRLPKEADFHFALARSYLAAGRRSDAERSLDDALHWAQTEKLRERYRAEFAALQGASTSTANRPMVRSPVLDADAGKPH